MGAFFHSDMLEYFSINALLSVRLEVILSSLLSLC